MLKFKITNSIFIVLIIALAFSTRWISISGWVFGLIVLAWISIVGCGVYFLSIGFFVPVKSKGKISSGAIAITFDDGPIEEKTEKILEILEAYKAPAAFFCIGNRVSNHPLIVNKIHQAGHLIGNHSYWHKNTFDLQSKDKIETELSETNSAIEKAIGLKSLFFRPPYGVTTPNLARAIHNGGFKTIGWNVRSFDTISKDAGALLKRVTKDLKAGDIVLFHDYCTITQEILPAFLEYTSRQGLKIVRVDELLNESAYAAVRSFTRFSQKTT